MYKEVHLVRSPGLSKEEPVWRTDGQGDQNRPRLGIYRVCSVMKKHRQDSVRDYSSLDMIQVIPTVV